MLAHMQKKFEELQALTNRGNETDEDEINAGTENHDDTSFDSKSLKLFQALHQDMSNCISKIQAASRDPGVTNLVVRLSELDKRFEATLSKVRLENQELFEFSKWVFPKALSTVPIDSHEEDDQWRPSVSESYVTLCDIL